MLRKANKIFCRSSNQKRKLTANRKKPTFIHFLPNSLSSYNTHLSLSLSLHSSVLPLTYHEIEQTSLCCIGYQHDTRQSLGRCGGVVFCCFGFGRTPSSANTKSTCSLRNDTILLYSSSQNNVLLSLDCCFSILFLFLAVVIIAGPSFRMQSIKSNNPIRINPPQ